MELCLYPGRMSSLGVKPPLIVLCCNILQRICCLGLAAANFEVAVPVPWQGELQLGVFLQVEVVIPP
jgi:hypothetical protein